MKSKKTKAIIVSSLLCSTLLVPFSAFAEETPTPSPVTEEQSNLMELTGNEEAGTDSVVVVEEFNESGQLESKTTYDDGSMTTVEPTTSSYTIPGVKDTGPSYISVTEPGLSYGSPIDTFTGSSAYLDTLAEWTYQFGASVIPALLSKNIWAGAAGSASYNTFLKPPKTKYFKTWIYETSDSYYSYGKQVSKQYTDSARTKLEKTVTHITKIRK